MLVITRKAEESIIINDEIEIVILECEPNRTKIGIKAPKSMSIMRKEVIEDIKFTNEAALSSDITQLFQVIDLSQKS